MTADRTKRLGNLKVSLCSKLYNLFYKAGSEEIRKHKWFKGVDWIGLLNKTIPAPIVPVCAHPGDTRNFEQYPELTEEELRNVGDLDSFKNLFRGLQNISSRPNCFVFRVLRL